MKKLVATVFALILLVSLFSMTAFAGITNGADGYYYTDAKAAYPDDYTEIYGMSVSFSIETPGPMGTGIGIMVGPDVKVFVADQAVVDLAAMMGVPIPVTPTMVDSIVAGYSGSMRFLDSSPLFTEGVDTNVLISVQPEPGTGADPIARVTNVVWLNKDGRDIGNPDAPRTGHPGNALLWCVLGVSAVGGAVVVIRLKSMKKGANAA